MLVTYKESLRRDISTGQCLFKVITREPNSCTRNGLMRCYGFIPGLEEGMPIEIEGTFDNGNNIYIVEKYKIVTENEMHCKLMLKHICRELTDKHIGKILEVSDCDLTGFIETDNAEDVLLKIFTHVKNRNKIVKLLLEGIRKIKENENLTRLFLKYGIPLDMIDELKHLCIEERDIIKNPYCLINCARISIETVDILAKNEYNVRNYDIIRLRGYTLYCMKVLLKSGNTCVRFDDLLYFVNKLLKKDKKESCQISSTVLNLCVTELFKIMHYEVIDGEVYVYFNEVKEEEDAVINGLIRISANKKDIPVKYSVEETEKRLGIHYNEGQKNAFAAVRTSGVKILTGPPGSGKTATIKGLIESTGFKTVIASVNENGSVLLSATTGMAAKVMNKSTGAATSTVHKMLHITPYGKNVKSKDVNDPIMADMIVVDEFSMAGLKLASMLFNAIQNNCILLLVGDEDQLESVEYGNVLHDLIESDVIEVYRLTEVMRSAGVICNNAKKINNGDSELVYNDSFVRYHCKDNEEAMNLLLQKYNKCDPENEQILCPIKRGVISTSSIHYAVEDKQQPVLLVYANKEFRLNSKIVMTENSDSRGYVNGDVGFIIGCRDNCLIVQFADKCITLKQDDFHNIEFADAVTIHKSQGSEYRTVHIVLPRDAMYMMSRRLLYTAVTRAKTQVYIYEVGNAIDNSVKNVFYKKRVTMLSTLLKRKVKNGKIRR